MPLIPNFFERLVLLKLNQGPGPLLELLGAGVFRIVSVALKLGVFEALSGEPRGVKDVAGQIRADERATDVLLEALAAFGYVRKRNGRYANTAMTAKWLVRGSPTSIADFLAWWQDFAFPFWDGHVEDALRRGKPVTTIYEWLDTRREGWQAMQAGFAAGARLAADDVVRKAKLPSHARRLLDVGGGHGVYSIAFCRRHRELSATIFDLPQALEVARQLIAAHGMQDRVVLKEGDFWMHDLGTGYDVALVFNIIHAYLPDQNTQLLRKVAGAMNPGGTIVIADQLTGGTPTATLRAVTRFFGLTYLITVGGQVYTFDEIARWLTTAGFTAARRIDICRAASSLVVATRLH